MKTNKRNIEGGERAHLNGLLDYWNKRNQRKERSKKIPLASSMVSSIVLVAVFSILVAVYGIKKSEMKMENGFILKNFQSGLCVGFGKLRLSRNEFDF